MIDKTCGWIQYGTALGDDWSNWWNGGKLFVYFRNAVELWSATVVWFRREELVKSFAELKQLWFETDDGIVDESFDFILWVT